MAYRQLTRDDRAVLSAWRQEGLSASAIAERMGRHRSTIVRELNRNWDRDGYRPAKAQEKAVCRRRRSRWGTHFSDEELELVNKKLREDFSPVQASGKLKQLGLLSISHETIYKHVWRDKANGGTLWKHLRQNPKCRRKRYGAYDSRGRLAGKRMIDERPAVVESRTTIGHWEIDTVLGRGSNHCILTAVERKTGFLFIGKLSARTTAEVNRVLIAFIKKHGAKVKTITSDNGTEFHGYKAIEEETQVPFYFAHPHHSWERGTNENTNGLIRQYFPKGMSFCRITQESCDKIAMKLNDRPRKRLHFDSPKERYLGVALQP
jgi:IS30 family transposase